MIVVAAPVPLPPPATGQPARDGEVEESRRVCDSVRLQDVVDGHVPNGPIRVAAADRWMRFGVGPADGRGLRGEIPG